MFSQGSAFLNNNDSLTIFSLKKTGFIRSTSLAVFALTLAFAATAQAAPIQIIHTNDLHSFMDHSENPKLGGYARVKTLMDGLRNRAKDSNVDTLILDAGDWSEGSPFYFANNGAESFKIMNEMGYDASALGNHDWLMGSKRMDEILKEVPLGFPILAANYYPSSTRDWVKGMVRPYFIFEKAGKKIAVFGLTTDEYMYSWRADSATINPMVEEAKIWLPEIRKQADFVIALTHIGSDVDRELAKSVDGIDLIVGGHSHEQFFAPIIENSPSGKPVSIVQTGSHGQYVGDLLIDVTEGRLSIDHYKLIEVNDLIIEDCGILDSVHRIKNMVYDRFGGKWLDEVIGNSEVPLIPSEDVQAPLNQLMHDTIEAETKADLIFDSPLFHGEVNHAGPITRYDLLDLYPRTFDVERKVPGWTIWKTYIPGYRLKLFLDKALKDGIPFLSRGLEFDTVVVGDKKVVKNIRIRGKSIKKTQFYSLAFSEGLGRALHGISEAMAMLAGNPFDTKVVFWDALAKQMQKVKTIRSTTVIPAPSTAGLPQFVLSPNLQ